MADDVIIPHLFRTEYRKIVAVLCHRFGLGKIEIAEDIASETFLTACQTWGLSGTPPDPVAWLYVVAKNKAKNHLQKSDTFENKILPFLQQDSQIPLEDIDLSEQNIQDSQLRMMFAICHPLLPAPSQIALALRILCGFGIEEIADAFLTNKETVNKRLLRARTRLRKENAKIEFPPDNEIDSRMDSVLTSIYLLFNEGYYSASQNTVVRKDLCLEAMRLCLLLIENTQTNKPSVNALLALMCFHASRFDARIDKNGEIVLYEEQDTALWNQELIGRGGFFLSKASAGTTISKYHLEAGIAWWSTQKNDSDEKWKNLIDLYDHLLLLEYTPIVALNRAYTLSKVAGKEAAIAETEKLALRSNYFYYGLLGELYSDVNPIKAIANYERAALLSKSPVARQQIMKKLDLCRKKRTSEN